VQAHHRELTFQEFIPGGDTDHWSFHGFADETGAVIAGFVGRKLRTYPAGAGESAFIEIAHDPVLEAIGRDVALRCPLKGPFKMDFKRDTRGWHLLEVNARYNLWHYLGARNGVNLMRVAYDYLVDGTRPQPAHARAHYRWLAFDLDFKAYRELAARGELSLGRWLASFAGTPIVCNLFSASDPGPWLALWRQRLTRRLGRAPGYLLSLNPWRSTAS